MTVIEWATSEWDPDTEAAYVEPGLECSISPNDGGYFWIVRLTASVSEYPEVWDAKAANSREEARYAVRRCVEKAAPLLTKRDLG